MAHTACTGKEQVCFTGAFNKFNGIDYFKGRSCSMTMVTEVEVGPYAVVPEAGMDVPISVGVLPKEECNVPTTGISWCLRHRWQSLL